ncbi:hypothetical protein QIH85_23900 [Bradyrhizobium japonicum]|uniref:hypothetical protein n=1 Tax=Bradyrhizobium japonicum TaxID=375 RepID=UPI00271534EA|nr:hypothetical protein [Bradyrhizobium japonicum]WLB24927.1 hypothetical protein QIH85_23900 [Bradyrhizobium japonicum]
MAEMMNGRPMQPPHSDEPGEFPERDAARIAAREPEVPPATADLIGVSPDDLDIAENTFRQQQHDEILHGLDVYAEAYNDKISAMNSSNLRLGQNMLKQVAKVKDAISTMWLLGAGIDNKEKADAAFVEKSERELEKLEHHT